MLFSLLVIIRIRNDILEVSVMSFMYFEVTVHHIQSFLFVLENC